MKQLPGMLIGLGPDVTQEQYEQVRRQFGESTLTVYTADYVEHRVKEAVNTAILRGYLVLFVLGLLAGVLIGAVIFR